jgi:putative membrane protein
VLDLMMTVACGILLGCFTGLVPGIHVNNVVIGTMALLTLLLSHLSPHQIAAFFISMAMVHTFVDFIPSILLGAPQEDSVLSVLPGHRMLLQGRGYEAIQLTVAGGLGAAVVGIALLPLGLAIFPYLYSISLRFLAPLLALVILYMVALEGSPRKMLYSLMVVIYSGVLGILVLNGGILSPTYALFPALTGLFGLSTLLLSIGTEPRIPKQGLESSRDMHPRGMAIGAGAGLVAGLVPSIGSAQSALVVQNLFKGEEDEEFLVALGGVNTTEALYAFLALYLIGNPRSGASMAVERLVPQPAFTDFLFMVGVAMVSILPAVGLTLLISRLAVRRIQRINYRTFSLAIVLLLVLFIACLTGWKGILIAITATAIGITTPILGIKRSHCMGVLMVPTILYFL